jgi:hypothetical protein
MDLFKCPCPVSVLKGAYQRGIQGPSPSTIVLLAYFSFIFLYVGAYENVCRNNFNSSLKICSVNGIDTDLKKLQPENTT